MNTPEKIASPPVDPVRVKAGVPHEKDDAVDPLTVDDDDEAESHQEDLLDEGIEESFPASDPVSVKRIT